MKLEKRDFRNLGVFAIIFGLLGILCNFIILIFSLCFYNESKWVKEEGAISDVIIDTALVEVIGAYGSRSSVEMPRLRIRMAGDNRNHLNTTSKSVKNGMKLKAGDFIKIWSIPAEHSWEKPYRVMQLQRGAEMVIPGRNEKDEYTRIFIMIAVMSICFIIGGKWLNFLSIRLIISLQ